jgi:predicted MFS family arabinose efflux permease
LIVGALTAIRPNQRGAILGLYSAVTYASMFAGTALYKPLFEGNGFMWCAMLSAVCIVPATLFSAARLRRHRHI